MLLTAVFTILMAGAALAANLTSRTYTLSPSGYIAWSDFTVPSDETVTINVSTSTVNKSGLTQKTLESLRYEIVNNANGRVVGSYSRYGAQRYVQLRSSKSQVYDRISVSLPAGYYRFRVTDTQAAVQPVFLSYAVTDARTDNGGNASVLVLPDMTVTAGQMVRVPVRDSRGVHRKVSGRPVSSNGSVAIARRSGTNLIVTGVKAGTCTISVKYQGRTYSFKVTVTAQRPEYQAYLKKISANRKYLYVRVRNTGNLPITFYSSGAAEYQVTGTDNNRASASRLAKLKFAKTGSVTVNPGKWHTIRLVRRSGLYPDYNLTGIEVRLKFRYDSVKYMAAVEDSWLDGQYHLRKKTATWYPAYSARNNFS